MESRKPKFSKTKPLKNLYKHIKEKYNIFCGVVVSLTSVGLEVI